MLKRKKDDKTGDDFCRLFEKRHKKELGQQVPELLTVARNKGLTEDILNNFFQKYEKVINDNNLAYEPQRIFNLDETGMNGNPVSGKVYVQNGKQAVVLNPN